MTQMRPKWDGLPIRCFTSKRDWVLKKTLKFLAGSSVSVFSSLLIWPSHQYSDPSFEMIDARLQTQELVVERRPSRKKKSFQMTGASESKKRKGDTVSRRCNSVVKIFSHNVRSKYHTPWELEQPYQNTVSGFLIDRKRLLTVASSIAGQIRLTVQKSGDRKEYVASVEAVDYDINLALINVNDESFSNDIEPVKFGELPKSRDEVIVTTFPENSDNVATVRGIVRRLYVRQNSFHVYPSLVIETDAKIGASGGPAFSPDGSVLGIVSGNSILPAFIIKRFIDDVDRHGKSTGFVTPGFLYQTMENPALKNLYGLNGLDTASLPPGITASGVLITEVDGVRRQLFNPNERECSIGLKKNDVVLALNNIDIEDDGCFTFRENERVNLTHTTSHHFTGDFIPALILRNKKLMTIQVPLSPPNRLVPRVNPDLLPTYFIYGGLVFMPLTMNYVDGLYRENQDMIPNIAQAANAKYAEKPGQELVIMSQILQSELTVGYEFKDKIVRKVDGLPFLNMKEFISLLGKNANKEFVKFEFDGDVIVLNRTAVKQKGSEILAQHSVPKPYSDDLKSVVELAGLKLN